MDLRGCIFVVIVFINCVCVTFITASQETDSYPDVGAHAYNNLRGKALEHKLREDIEREMADVLQLERSMRSHLDMITEKKRQLEIKKRQPVQCLVNIVSCWKRK